MAPNILTPAAALVVWTIIMCVWMAATRGPALRKLGTDKLKHSARGQDLEGLIPEEVNWKAHNYVHLLEQPTIFYAAVFILVLSGYGPVEALVAWVYVVLRIVHSVWQATVNTQPMRAILFLVSTIALGILAVQALLATL